jgi:hypothetical protein
MPTTTARKRPGRRQLGKFPTVMLRLSLPASLVREVRARAIIEQRGYGGVVRDAIVAWLAHDRLGVAVEHGPCQDVSVRMPGEVREALEARAGDGSVSAVATVAVRAWLTAR